MPSCFQVIFVRPEDVDIGIGLLTFIGRCRTARRKGADGDQPRKIVFVFKLPRLIVADRRKTPRARTTSPYLHIDPPISDVERIGSHCRKGIRHAVLDRIDRGQNAHQRGYSDGDH